MVIDCVYSIFRLICKQAMTREKKICKRGNELNKLDAWALLSMKWEEEKEILFNFQYMNARGAYWIILRMKDIRRISIYLTHATGLILSFPNNPILLILLKRTELSLSRVYARSAARIKQAKFKVSLSISFRDHIFPIHNRSKQFFH